MVEDPEPAVPAQYDAVLASFYDKRPSLELSTVDLCFVVVLQLEATAHGLSSFSEEQLVDVFARVCAVVQPDAEQVPARGTHTIRRLRTQRLLTRVDGAGVLRTGEFALSRLASAIVDFFIEDDALTEHSLHLLSTTLLSSLSEVRRGALRAKSRDDWQAHVVGPLRITAGELILGIERRQRSFDGQQEEFQRQISGLLSADWFEAVEQCQALLDDTARTLSQLSELLLSYAHQFEEVLQDVLDAAIEAEAETAEAVTQRVFGQVDRIATWGSARQQAWSEYYEYVHRYLRDVVRLDPSRALTQRLRQQLTQHHHQPFSLTVASASSLVVPRMVRPPVAPPPLRRPRVAKEKPPEEVQATPKSDPLEAKLQEWIGEGVTDLSELTARATESLDADQHFRTAGRVAELAALLSVPNASAGRPWVPVRAGLAIEQWQVAPLAHASSGRKK